MQNRNGKKAGAAGSGETRIDEMIDRIHEVETLNMVDASELLQYELSEEEKGRILTMAMHKMKAESNESIDSNKINGQNEIVICKKRGVKRSVLIASLVAVFAFATTAVAAEVFQWDTRISNHLGMNETNRAELAESGMNVDVSAVQNGVTIKAVQTLGDANNMYILLDVTTPEGTVICPNSRFDMIYLKVDGATSLGYSCDFLPDESENDNKATLLLSMEANKSINDKTIDLRFENLGHYKMETGEITPDFEGDWKLQWKLNYQDSSTKYPVDQSLSVNGETVNVDSISVSPIALNVKVSGSYIKEYDAVPPQPQEGDLISVTAVTLKDGTVLSQDDASGWGTSIDGDTYTINMQMKKLLDTEQIASITLNDTVIPLK